MRKPYGRIDKNTAKRVFEGTRYIEQQPRSKIERISGPTDFGGITYLKVTTAVNPLSGSTVGHLGRGKIQVMNQSTFALSDASTTVYPILNPTTSTYAVGAIVACGVAYGYFSILTVDACSHIS